MEPNEIVDRAIEMITALAKDYGKAGYEYDYQVVEMIDDLEKLKL